MSANNLHNSTRKVLWLVIFIISLFCQEQTAKAQWWKDTVWTKKTDQVLGFYMLKFSSNDSIIVGHGMEKDMFYLTTTGNEITRIPGNNEVFFINNDKNFIRLRQDNSKFEIFDTKTFSEIDSLEDDGLKIVDTPPISISNDNNFLSAGIQNGFRIWNIQSKKIYKTKIYPYEENLITCRFTQLSFTCDNKIIGHLNKTYQDPEHPGDSKYYKKYTYYIIYDMSTLDSLDYVKHSLGMYISPNCKYYATITGDGTTGVEVYDFNTKELLWKIPVNSLTLTGLEFSPDDKYLVTASQNNSFGMTIWDMETGQEHFHYISTAGYSNIDVSHNGLYITYSVGGGLRLIRTHFDDVSVKEPSEKTQIFYPNPTSDYVNVNVSFLRMQESAINIYDVFGNCVLTTPSRFHWDTPPEEGNYRIDVSTLPAGVYFVRIGNENPMKFMVVR